MCMVPMYVDPPRISTMSQFAYIYMCGGGYVCEGVQGYLAHKKTPPL